MSVNNQFLNARNVLISKDDVGRGKPAPYQLPGPEFAYGKQDSKDRYGVKEVLHNWSYHAPTKTRVPPRDFRKLNKLSLANNKTNARQVDEFRRNVDVRVKVKEGQYSLPMYLPEEDYAYGKANRPSTPINQVIGNDYGNVAAMMSEEQYKTRYEEKKMAATMKDFNPRSTKTENFRKEVAKEKLGSLATRDNPNETFKLGKYQHVSPKVQPDNKQYKEMKRSATSGFGNQNAFKLAK